MKNDKSDTSMSSFSIEDSEKIKLMQNQEGYLTFCEENENKNTTNSKNKVVIKIKSQTFLSKYYRIFKKLLTICYIILFVFTILIFT